VRLWSFLVEMCCFSLSVHDFCTSPWAFTAMMSYDESVSIDRSFVWLSPDAGPLFPFYLRSRPLFLPSFLRRPGPCHIFFHFATARGRRSTSLLFIIAITPVFCLLFLFFFCSRIEKSLLLILCSAICRAALFYGPRAVFPCGLADVFGLRQFSVVVKDGGILPSPLLDPGPSFLTTCLRTPSLRPDHFIVFPRV